MAGDMKIIEHKEISAETIYEDALGGNVTTFFFNGCVYAFFGHLQKLNSALFDEREAHAALKVEIKEQHLILVKADECSDDALARVKELEVKLAKSIDDMDHERREYADYRARNPLSSVKPPEPEPTWKPHVTGWIQEYFQTGGEIKEDIQLGAGFCRKFNCVVCPIEMEFGNSYRLGCEKIARNNAAFQEVLYGIGFPWQASKPTPEPEPDEYACPDCGGKTFWYWRGCGRERRLTCNDDHDSCGARSGWFPIGEYYPRWLKKRPPDEKKEEHEKQTEGER